MEEQNIFVTKAYKRAHANLREKLRSSFLRQYRHYLMPGFNLNSGSSVDDWDIENTVIQYQEYPYHCDLPKPLLPPARLPRIVVEGGDPALELISLKRRMNDDIQRLKNYYEIHKKEFQAVSKKDVKWTVEKETMKTTIPKYVADIAEIIDKDPDPYFKGAYNWYYTGGSLKSLRLNNLDILMFPFMGELIAAPITTTKELSWKPLLRNSAKHRLDNILYELEHRFIGNTVRILGRHKSYCDIYQLSKYEDAYRLSKRHRQKTDVPYVGADLSANNESQYCTLNVERLVTLWDLDKKMSVNSGTVRMNTELNDSWGSIKFQSVDPNVLVYTDRCCIYYLDVRLSFNKPSSILCPKNDLEKCERISISVPSRNSFCRYVGTYHNVLLCDDRVPEQCVQQKWTHQFKSTPILANLIDREDKEILVLSSQIAGENSIILNTWKTEDISFSYNYPFCPPQIADTLNESQLQGMCLNTYLRSRFKLCNAGSTVLSSDMGDVYFFIQNAIGDIFYQCITHDTALNKYSTVNCNAYCVLDDWEKALSAQSDILVPLAISDKSNMSDIYENLTNKKLRLKYKKDETDSYEPSWKQSLDKLNTYIDILAPELLAMWEISDEVPVPITAAPHQKVLNWLESAKGLSQSQEEPEIVATPLNSQEIMGISQEYDITYLDDSNVLQELLLPKVRTKSAKRRGRP